MYGFWYDYVKPKYSEKSKLYFIDAENFIVHVKANHIYKDIAKNVYTILDTSKYELEKRLTNGKKKKVIGAMKDELGGEVVKYFVGLR